MRRCVHSSFKPVPNADYVIPVEIDPGTLTDVYVLKRPYVDYFMEEMGKHYEIVVFTASLAKYADPLLDLLDIHNVIRWRLFRESCYPFQGNYVKDLTSLGRPLERTIILDNSPHSYAFQPQKRAAHQQLHRRPDGLRFARRRAGARGAGGGGGRRGDAGGERRLLTEDAVRGEGSADAAERGAVELINNLGGGVDRASVVGVFVGGWFYRVALKKKEAAATAQPDRPRLTRRCDPIPVRAARRARERRSGTRV